MPVKSEAARQLQTLASLAAHTVPPPPPVHQQGPAVAMVEGPHRDEVGGVKEECTEMLEGLIRGVREAADYIEDNMDMGLPGAVEKLMDVVRRISARAKVQQKVAPPPGGSETIAPIFGPDQGQQAADALRKFQKLVSDTFDAGAKGSAGAAVQLEVKFERPFVSWKDVASRLAALHGSAGPKVAVQQLEEAEGKVWQKLTGAFWWAEKGGDGRKAVFRMNVPARSAYRKASRVSVQYHVASRQLSIQSVKQNLLDYAVQWVAAFGEVDSVAEHSEAATQSKDIVGFLQKGARMLR